MSDIQFFQTAMGRKFFEHTVPALVRELVRLNENVERLTAAIESAASAPKDKRDAP